MNECIKHPGRLFPSDMFRETMKQNLNLKSDQSNESKMILNAFHYFLPNVGNEIS